jgi:hypothetical protein
MRSLQLTALVLGAAALFFTARPAQAQVWIAPRAPIVVAPAPIVVSPGWGATRYWGVRYRGWGGRRGWYAGVRGQRGGVVVAGRRRW